MGRIRAMTAPSELDRAIQSYVATAVRSLQQALAVCQKSVRGEESPARLARVRRDLMAALGAAQGVRFVASRYDATDIDLQPTRPYERQEEEPVVEENPVAEEPAVTEEVEDAS